MGTGRPIVLDTRFRGNMDKWDPVFLDARVGNGFRVITFDYSGLGLSTGRMTYNLIEMASGFLHLIAGLGLKDVVIALVGRVAQPNPSIAGSHLIAEPHCRLDLPKGSTTATPPAPP